jgi:hypothetical protein
MWPRRKTSAQLQQPTLGRSAKIHQMKVKPPPSTVRCAQVTGAGVPPYKATKGKSSTSPQGAVHRTQVAKNSGYQPDKSGEGLGGRSFRLGFRGLRAGRSSPPTITTTDGDRPCHGWVATCAHVGALIRSRFEPPFVHLRSGKRRSEGGPGGSAESGSPSGSTACWLKPRPRGGDARRVFFSSSGGSREALRLRFPLDRLDLVGGGDIGPVGGGGDGGGVIGREGALPPRSIPASPVSAHLVGGCEVP